MDNSLAIYLFHQGTNYFSYRFMGAQYTPQATTFRVWAPNAQAVHVVGDFNEWNLFSHQMLRITKEGLWEITIPEVSEYAHYQYAILTKNKKWIYKSDPFAYHSELRPKVASKVYNLDNYRFQDDEWMEKRKTISHLQKPMNIYEVHLGSWRRYADGNVFDYRKLGYELSKYAKEMGYTHLEIMPVFEYPLDESWGYQVTGFFSLTSRYGTPADFKAFVDICHQAGIGVIVDWVPGHFGKDAHGLIEFDGSYLYEHLDPTRREHQSWGTRCFDYGRPEIQSFLVSSAMYLLEECHVDGLRVDAVASMLYLDFDRTEWHPNSLGTNINLEALAFIKKLNQVVHEYYPGVLTIAEESTTFPDITKPVQDGGLGFDFKWNMGWMNDTLTYFSHDPIYRKALHHKITFQMTYIFSENFILALSHDEVVHGKKSLLNKMPGSYEDKFFGIRAYLAYMMSHPGKKLTFMGYEFGQFIEWNERQELDWLLLQYENHQGLHTYVKYLNHLYLQYPALYENDTSWDGFRWINSDDADHNVFSYLRLSPRHDDILVICNFSGIGWPGYEVNIDNGQYELILATREFDAIPKKVKIQNNRMKLDLPPLCGIYYRKVKRKDV
ncbi:MAG: 1,4-alpha-glucan branching protein GlgB [Bacilli bacterium]